MASFFARLAGMAIVFLARFITAVRGLWQGIAPAAGRRIYFANHTSHGDFILVWAVLPPRLRRAARPVAGADYWLASRLRRFLGCDVFKAVLIDRTPSRSGPNPIEQMCAALDAGASLILFPEGTRNTTGALLLPFKSGLFHLARARPDVDLVPVWIDNLNRVMPKGEVVPIPLICTVTFGAPVRLHPGEAKAGFLARAEQALLALAPRKAETAS
jgi:1-acyl-sn-glycerol-3-phosphate acyltransferase